ncbi:MAG: hypothetical protein U5L09_09785 [Bacteroidales bacterium]|nr:hypothetical protein [Bacteroidales bacterium]
MSQRILIKNIRIVNDHGITRGSVAVAGEKIEAVLDNTAANGQAYDRVIEGKGRYLLPGIIDDQVHFIEPGLTHKGDLYTESKAAVAGESPSFMEMPNTNPGCYAAATEEKYTLAQSKSLANYSFYMGVTNDNVEEVLKTDPKKICGIKIFMGASTGNMLVNNRQTLNILFRDSPALIATHCEDEDTIRENTADIRHRYGEAPPFSVHPLIRSAEACYRSSSLAAELAAKHSSRLHILHLSTKKELELFSNRIPSSEKNITAEACIHHLRFDDTDYDKKQWRIKWNPAIKRAQDREALFEARTQQHYRRNCDRPRPTYPSGKAKQLFQSSFRRAHGAACPADDDGVLSPGDDGSRQKL